MVAAWVVLLSLLPTSVDTHTCIEFACFIIALTHLTLCLCVGVLAARGREVAHVGGVLCWGFMSWHGVCAV